MAPMSLRARTVELIRREVEKHTEENPGRIIAKMNSLVDSEIIRELYVASQKGVQIDLLIRGICCLRPGLQGISENIRVVSIVGRFLEHTRIIYFWNGGEEEYYLSSADWMPRNLNRRVETMFPVEEPANKQLLNKIFEVYFKDTRKARLMMSDGSYQRIQPEPGELPFSSQDELIRLTGELIREEAVAAQHTPRTSHGKRRR